MTNPADDPSLPSPTDRPEDQAAWDTEVGNETGQNLGGEGEGTENLPSQTDWFVLARKLRQHNRELIKTVVQLEQSLGETQAQLQDHLGRSHQFETLIAQQNEELLANQTQITRLLGELETAHQAAQNQQELVTNLTQQVQLFQQQLAQLERECAQIQEAYNEQCQKTLEAEQELQKSRQQFYHPQSKDVTISPDNASASVSFRIARSKPGIPWVAESIALEASLQSLDPDPHETPAAPAPEAIAIPPEDEEPAAWEDPHWLQAAELTGGDEGEDYTPFTFTPEPETPEAIASEDDALGELDEDDLALALAFDLAQEMLDEMAPAPAPDLVPATGQMTPEQNWPSPRIFPEVKKRRSLATVELPRFL